MKKQTGTGDNMAQELNIRLRAETGIPLYRQIYTYIRDEIRSGSLEAEERLPSTRALSASLHVARSTAELAYSQLLSEGYIRVKKNSGYYVSEIENLSELHFEDSPSAEERRAWAERAGGLTEEPVPALTRVGRYVEPLPESDPADPGSRPSVREAGLEKEVIDFSLRHTEMSVFPYSTWKRIMREVMVDANSEMFSHSEPGGDFSLRAAIGHYLHFSRGVRCAPEQIIVGAGNDYLLMLLRQILGEGRQVAMENPSYLRAAQIFDSFGYRICPVRMDRDGMNPESVARSGADLVYAMPAHQFPMGCVMPVARRVALLGWAVEKEGRYIIEDDYDSEFRYRGKPIPALQSLDHNGKVIYLGTFSKVIAPAIRISYMILPTELLALYRERCWFFSSTVSRIDQRILTEFMKNGHFERHLNRMRSLYRARHDELLAQLKVLQGRFRILGAGTGLHLVLEAGPDAAGKFTEKQLAGLAEEKGVIVYCLSDYDLPGSAEGNTEPAGGQGRQSDEENRKHPAGGREPEKKAAVRPPALLLGFGALNEEQIREGVRRLAEAWA